MDESFCGSVSGSKFPDGSPTKEWTVEELLHWSLDQYQNRAIEQTEQNIASLKDRCERECEDVMTLHALAADMASKNDGNPGGEGAGGEENVDPQRSENNAAEGGELATKPTTDAATNVANAAADVANAVADGARGGAPPRPPSNSIEILMIVGPHAPSKYLLRPRPGQPCLLGRSKGKKFVKNGVSLHKDQEVSTTHAKFVVEGGGLGGEGGGGPKFYFVDVGSTNGTVYKGEPLEPNVRLALENGTELKVGNSVLRVILG
mmetsp:Transcript_42442/g.90296  ORF Transcript_42442/g.90296 Transcript_42442/m.90296 type:complete len:262 (-) Transcript_42442:207-992(-)